MSRCRVGGVLGVVRGLVDLGLHLGGDRRLELVGQDAGLAELGAEARQRVLRLEARELLGGAVLRLLVVGRVRGEADDLGLDERRAVAAPRPIDRFLRRPVAGEHVRAVDDHAGDAVAGSARRDVRDGELARRPAR